MIKKIVPYSLLLILVLFSSLLRAEPEKGQGYQTITPAQPTQNPEKIEVIEFFWYGCPSCYALEPHLEQWLKKIPDNVQFIRQPAMFNEIYQQHAKAYFTAEALGVVDKVHADLFDEIQNAIRNKKKNKLTSEDQLAEFFAARGVDEKDFRTAYNSFLVDTKMRQAKGKGPRYGVTAVPTLIINGKYKTNGRMAKSFENMITVTNELIEQENAGE